MLRIALASFAVIATAAIAQAPNDTTGQRVKPSQDPNEVICIRELIPGSVFMKQRVCRTRAEWAEHRLQSRQTIEKVQALKPVF